MKYLKSITLLAIIIALGSFLTINSFADSICVSLDEYENDNFYYEDIIIEPANNEVDEHPDNAVLVGLIVRHGDIIDAITGIYQTVDESGELGEVWNGEQIGGNGGGETFVKRAGYVITGIRVVTGNYFYARHILRLQVIWTKYDESFPGETVVESEYLGTLNYASDISEPYVISPGNEEGSFAAGLSGYSTYHTSGELFLADFSLYSYSE